MAKLIDITNNRVIMIGTIKECRKYKRAHYDYFTRIFFEGAVQRG